MTALVDKTGAPLADRLQHLSSILPDRSKRKAERLIPTHEIDPKQKILDELGDISELKVFHNLVLVALYKRPALMKYGSLEIELIDKSLREDEFQGVVGLVVAKGSAAFRDDGTKTFYDDDVQIGDWVYFRASDGLRMMVKNTLCRRIEDIFICGTVPHPDYVY